MHYYRHTQSRTIILQWAFKETSMHIFAWYRHQMMSRFFFSTIGSRIYFMDHFLQCIGCWNSFWSALHLHSRSFSTNAIKTTSILLRTKCRIVRFLFLSVFSVSFAIFCEHTYYFAQKKTRTLRNISVYAFCIVTWKEKKVSFA